MEEKGFMEIFDLKDPGGGTLHNQMRVDGKAPEVTAAIFRNIKDIKIRDDDIMLCTPPKSVEYNSWFDYVREFEQAIEEEPDRIHLVYYEDMKENGPEEVRKIALFLGLDVATDEEFIQKVVEKCHIDNMKGKIYDPEYKKRVLKEGFHIYRKGCIKCFRKITIPQEFDGFAMTKVYDINASKQKSFFNSSTTYTCPIVDPEVTKNYTPDRSRTGDFQEVLPILPKPPSQIGDWKNYFTVAESEAFDALYDRKMKGSKLKFRFEPSKQDF